MNQIKTFVLEICIVLLFVNGCCAQLSGSEVCKIQDGLQGECRYRIDHVNLDVIWVKIDPCSEPVSVTFTITNDHTKMDISHTFKGSQLIRLHGYTERIFLRVTMGETYSGTFRLEADIERYDGTNTDFIFQDFDLHVASERCFNIASKMAIGIMSGLFLVALAMGIVLLVFWRRKRKAENSMGNCQRNGAGPSSSTNASLGTDEILLQNSIANAAEMDNNNFDNNNTVDQNRVTEAGQNENQNVNTAAENRGAVNEQNDSHREILHGLAVLESGSRTGGDRNRVVDSSGHANVDRAAENMGAVNEQNDSHREIPNGQAVPESGSRTGGDRNQVVDSSGHAIGDGRNVSEGQRPLRPSASQGRVHSSGNRRCQEAVHLEQRDRRSCVDRSDADLVSPARNRRVENDRTNTDSRWNNVHSTKPKDSCDGVQANNGRETRLHQNRSRNHAPKQNDVVRSGERLSYNSSGGTGNIRTLGCGVVDGDDGGGSSGADGGIADESGFHCSDGGRGVDK